MNYKGVSFIKDDAILRLECVTRCNLTLNLSLKFRMIGSDNELIEERLKHISLLCLMRTVLMKQILQDS